jgi:hypothetical protein
MEAFDTPTGTHLWTDRYDSERDAPEASTPINCC